MLPGGGIDALFSSCSVMIIFLSRYRSMDCCPKKQTYVEKRIMETPIFTAIGVPGGGPGGPWPPLEKLVSLAGQKWDLGRTEIGAWQDRNGSLA